MSEPQQNQNSEQNKQMMIVGVNMVILAVYSVLCLMENGGGITEAFFIAIQVITCWIVGASQRKWVWGLSGLLVLIIGFASCVNYGFR